MLAIRLGHNLGMGKQSFPYSQDSFHFSPIGDRISTTSSTYHTAEDYPVN